MPSIALVALLCSLAFPALALAQPKPRELRSDRAAAEQALEEAQDALDGRGVRTGREVTHALLELARAVPALSRADRREARTLLARPSDTGTKEPGKWDAPPQDARSHCTTNFCFHWVVSEPDAPSLADTDGDTVPNYVESMEAEFENVFQVQHGTGATQLGWAEPKSDGSLGGDSGKTDVYISELAGDIFGYAAPDGSQPVSNSLYSYLVMDDDYIGYGYDDTPLDALRVTAAHEYNHVLQFSYDAYQDIWMFESTAVWAEEKVYDDVDDYLFYLDNWAACSEIPITEAPDSGGCSLKIYGSGVWNLWLDERHGPEVVRSAWERSLDTTPASLAPAAYDRAIRDDGGGGFVDEFNRFAAAAAEWRAPASGLPEGSSYGHDVERVGTLADGGSTTRRLHHTTFAYLDVPIPPGNPERLRLNVAIPAGTPGAVALVARTGTDATAGSVTTRLHQLPNGGEGGVLLENPGAYGRITAVLVNSSYDQSGWNGEDWIWTRDDQAIGAALSTTGDPVPPGGTVDAGGTTTAPPPPPPPPGPAPDTTAPQIAQLGISATSFRAARRGPTIAARGTRVVYQLSEAAGTTFRVDRLVRGRRVRSRCVRKTRRNRRRRVCTRVLARGSFTHEGRSGLNQFRFRGRLNGRSLPPGRYRMTATAADGAGNVSAPRAIRFRIVR